MAKFNSIHTIISHSDSYVESEMGLYVGEKWQIFACLEDNLASSVLLLAHANAQASWLVAHLTPDSGTVTILNSKLK